MNIKFFSIIIFSSTVLLSTSAFSERICEDYIPDEWPNARYSTEDISGDNIVTDSKTGLMWKKCSEGLSGTGCTVGSFTQHTWQEALVLPQVLNVAGFAGYTDWRLPNKKELRTLVARNCYGPSINEVVFPRTPTNEPFWSSSPNANYDEYAWYVNFNSGFDDIHTRDSNEAVRLVRSD